MAWDRFDYPSEAAAGIASGSVTLEGRVGRDGGVSAVRATDGGAFPETAAKALATAAVKQVSSWRFEPSTREDRFRDHLLVHAGLVHRTGAHTRERRVSRACEDFREPGHATLGPYASMPAARASTIRSRRSTSCRPASIAVSSASAGT